LVAAVAAVVVATTALARGEAASMAADADGQMSFPDGDDEELVQRSMAASVEV
jgi:hypothetical protein